MEKRLPNIVERFNIDGTPGNIAPLGEGFINDTFFVAMEGESRLRYILQRKNSNIFKDIPAMMENIRKVTSHLKSRIAAAGGDPSRETITLIPARDGKFYLHDGEDYWCMTLFIPDTLSYTYPENEGIAEQGGRGIGRFQALLSDFDEPLTDTLPGFHNIRFRFGQWDRSLALDPLNRAASVRPLIGEIEKRRDEMAEFFTLIENGTIPKRVTHNDTKISNILFDTENRALCVIDLDTVLNAPCLYDFGDSIRSYANTGMEDDSDLDRVEMDIRMYKAYLNGYLSEAGSFLTGIEREYLPFSAKYITYEQVLRFLMDYIDGDTYYKTKYREHNLVRARAQCKLLQSIEKNLGV